MKKIFYRGDFSNFRVSEKHIKDIRSDVGLLYETKHFSSYRTTVFISHKHSDLSELQDIIGFLENIYDVEVYIDSQDPTLPNYTCEATAMRIKDVIEHADKFILMATNDAIESKWCNWELGYGDSKKFPENLAIFPINDSNLSESSYKGHEYLKIYPHIVKYNGNEKYRNGNFVKAGYYVSTLRDNVNHITPLKNWLNK